MAYTVRLEKAAKKDLEGLPRKDRRRAWAAIQSLAEDPRPHGVKKLAGAENTYRVRVGSYRILYTIEDQIVLVVVVAIGHRRDVYR